MRAILWAATLTLAAGSAGQAAAQDAPAIKALSDCGTIADVRQKAACYDTAVASLNSAIKSGEIVVVQRKEAQAAQRGAFGFNLPGLSIFDRLGGKDDDKADKKAAKAQPDADGTVRDETGGLQAIIATAKRTTRDGFGKWVIELEDGAVWRQTDSETLSPAPRAGSKVEIKRASFGSFLMKIDGLPAVRAKRSE